MNWLLNFVNGCQIETSESLNGFLMNPRLSSIDQ